jgi:hypothetical protein
MNMTLVFLILAALFFFLSGLPPYSTTPPSAPPIYSRIGWHGWAWSMLVCALIAWLHLFH